MKKISLIRYISCAAGLLTFSVQAFATENLGAISGNLTDFFGGFANLAMGGSYILAFSFFIGSLLKYKERRDSPRRVKLAVPVTLFIVSLGLLLLGFILTKQGQNIFGQM